MQYCDNRYHRHKSPEAFAEVRLSWGIGPGPPLMFVNQKVSRAMMKI